MHIGVPAETYPGETRVAATPETVKKLVAGGRHTVSSRPAPALGASVRDEDFAAAGRHDRRDAPPTSTRSRHRPEGAAAPRRGAAAAAAKAAILVGLLSPHEGVDDAGQDRRHGVRHGAAAAHHARAGDGRAVVAGQHRRLQGGAPGRQRIRPLHADADDRGRHGEGRARAGARRRRRRPAGDRHRQAAGRGHRSLRRAPGGEGAGRVARREVRRGAAVRRGEEAAPGDGRRLRARDERRLQAPPGRAGRRARQGRRHRHHHRADPRPAGAGAGHARRRSRP